MNMNLKKTGGLVLTILLPPLAMYLIMEVLCRITTGSAVIGSSLDLMMFLKNAGIATCTALAMNMNLGAGRMDMSLGAQRLIAAVIGGNIALSLGLGALPTFVLCIVLGAVSGGVVGFVFVKTKVAPMILSLGMLLIYECIVFQLYPEGVHFYGNAKIAPLASAAFIIPVTLVIIVLLLLVLNYTSFGYHYRAVASSAAIAQSEGVPLVRTIVVTFVIAGALIGVAGIFDAAYIGTVEAPLSMGSMEKVFGAMTAVLIGRVLALRSNVIFGTVSAVFAVRVMNQALSVMRVEANLTSVINTVVLLLAMLVLAVVSQRRQKKAMDARRAQVLAE